MQNQNTDKITVRNACEHNLKSVDIEIPHNALTVVTGVSGSGKSSLIYDIICREGQRRYLDSFSSYAKIFLSKLSKPDVEYIGGLRPALSVDQKSSGGSARSTVGTMTGIYDYLRLLFARTAESDDYTQKADRALFSFNSEKGSCPKCAGLGLTDKIDPELLIENKNKTLREGALKITTSTGYTVYSQVTIDVMNQVCESEGFNVDIPWKDLTSQQKDIILNGSNKIKIPFGKHTLESRMKWKGITAKPREEGYYKGILPVMEEILKRDRNKNILRFVRSVCCDECGGSRLNRKALSYKFYDKNIAEYAAMTIVEMNEFFISISDNGDNEIINSVSKKIIDLTDILIELGLAYLTFDRVSTSISGGEVQRIRLANQLAAELRGIMYIFDEPSIGLHASDNKKMIKILKRLRDNSNTVIVVEHDEDFILNADYIVDIGPNAGINGGKILYSGSAEYFFNNLKSVGGKTAEYFLHHRNNTINTEIRKACGSLIINNACYNNLKNISPEFKLSCFNVLTGVSGAGKTTLAHKTLSAFLSAKLNGTNNPVGKHTSVSGYESISKVIEIDQSPIGRTPRSNPATYTKLFDKIRDLFAAEPEAKARKWTKGRFSFNNKGGRCEKCEGAGYIQTGMHFMGNAEIECDECKGKRFNSDTLKIKYKGKNIFQVLELSISEALSFFADQPQIMRILTTMNDLGLGYISLGQRSTTLSGGEAQRIKLASELAKPTTKHTLYILDEPTTGLHFSDVDILLKCLNRLVDSGNTVIVIEHNLELIKAADHIIDLGPGSGKYGGEIVFSGTPTELLNCTKSSTAAALNEKKTLISSLKPLTDNNRPISLRSVSTHNLKNIDIDIPVNKSIVITGVSGSGKSSLAFDTIFAEGQNRFSNSFSTYARMSAGIKDRPDIGASSGIMPTIAISRKTASRNPSSTVGTVSEIYDLYRLLYARAGISPNHTSEAVLSSQFTFNRQTGACPKCKGLGEIIVCDQDKLITNPELPLFAGALNGTKTGKFYTDPDDQYAAIINTIGNLKGIDYNIPWNKLSKSAQIIALEGCGNEEFDVVWNYKRKNRDGKHKFRSKWIGLQGYIHEEYERKHADKRADAMMNVMRPVKCPACRGTRLKQESLSYRINNLNIAELSFLSIYDSIQFFNDMINDPAHFGLENIKYETCKNLINEIIRRLGFLDDLGLSYLSVASKSSALSGGEAQRVRLASGLGSELTSVCYILDEPTLGLHSKDISDLCALIEKLRLAGNTVISVEHDADFIRTADYIFDLGPGAGNNGGQIVAEGSLKEIMTSEKSLTGKYLNQVPEYRGRDNIKWNKFIEIKAANANNLQNIYIAIPVAGTIAAEAKSGIICLTGVSGSGKSSLMFDVIYKSALAGKQINCESITGLDQFDDVIRLEAGQIAGSSASTAATFTGVFDYIRDIFAKTDTAKQRKYKKGHFSFNTKGGRCEKCKGSGIIKTSMDFLSDIYTVCDECSGQRYQSDILACLYRSKSIFDVLEMTCREALSFFCDIPKIMHILNALCDTGLGYLKLGQSGNTLSSGELQRLKLASELCRHDKKRTLFLFDEPTRGLHFSDVEILIKLFRRLSDAGNTLMIIEHNTDMILSADYVIDLGPEGGTRGGTVMAVGSPKIISETCTSYSGQTLKKAFELIETEINGDIN